MGQFSCKRKSHQKNGEDRSGVNFLPLFQFTLWYMYMYICCKVMAMSQLRGQTCPLYIAFCGGLRHQHTKGTDGSQNQPTYELTEPSQPMMSDNVSDEDRPPHRELHCTSPTLLE